MQNAHSCLLTLVHALTLSLFNNSDQSPAFLAVIACRIIVHARRISSLSRSSSSSSVCGDSVGQIFSSCIAVAASATKSPASFFLRRVPRSCLQILLPSKPTVCLDGLPSGMGYLWFVSFCQPQIVAILREVGSARSSVIFRRCGCDVTELDASFSAFLSHMNWCSVGARMTV